MPTIATEHVSKSNLGVYTNPAHNLWIAASKPTLEEVERGKGLKEGEVTIWIKSSGICGWAAAMLPLYYG